MIALLLLAQITVADSTYSTLELRRFVGAAAEANRRAPATLAGYRAVAESDMALLRPDPRGREHAQQLEQVESRVAWRRVGSLEQHVVGYRARATSMSLSALSLLRRPWIIPSLYGDRLSLLVDLPSVPGATRGWARLAGVHPLAADRDSAYRFTGGDTVQSIRIGGRTIPVVRIHVEPRAGRGRLLLFRGDLDVAADRMQIVRLHGAFVAVQAHSGLRAHVERLVLRTAVLVDVEEGELRQRYWLPTYERLEVQAASSLDGGFRPAARIVTRLRAQELDTVPGPPSAPALAEADTGAAAERRLSYAPRDSLDAFGGWGEEIGAASTAAAAADFDDVVRPGAAPGGPPRVAWGAAGLPDVLRYDKAEGLYTGMAATWGAAEGAPGVRAGAHAGWAWQDRTPRGGAAVRWQRGRWTWGAAARRELDNTNDFVPTLEGPATVGALLGSVDDYDYVARAAATLSAARWLDADGRRVLRLEVGPGRDAAVRNRVTQGIVRLDSAFRPNRPAAEGSYVREAVALEVNPDVSGDLLEPGVGLALAYERGDGGLRWQRVDARLAARHTAGPLTYLLRADAAALFGGSPPQKVIEVGGNEGLPGYGYKEFGGDRAVLLRLGAAYALPVLRAPLRLRPWLALPGPSPAVTVGLQGGWTAAVAPATRAALAAFGFRPQARAFDPTLALAPLTQPTEGVRATLGISLDLFGGGIGVGIARPVDHAAPWGLILGSALQW
ncbi:MAG: hypothetical protein JWM27_3901 [Gemmatimonadetes bacterium]|nr:hypothetical protein [Gemmatimonadota bacterium]